MTKKAISYFNLKLFFQKNIPPKTSILCAVTHNTSSIHKERSSDKLIYFLIIFLEIICESV
ncbi:hypothetical protein SAMN05421825_1650 [Epilithonimonas hungarica]|uniref:Uncharacterized protein n=1 Tax=Epilithonimonas hungarica TaxID=454006 RepID=A0A1G7M428_9FLAO|nr:hypothetical protein SAMN05421825_1650 [Epilithonimonas hungarica]